MEFNQLEVLVSAIQDGGFSRAADRLGCTQPAISQAIHKLEAEFGELLLQRSAKEVTLTACGQIIYDYAMHLLNIRKDAESAIQEQKDLRQGKLVIGANEYTVSYLLPAITLFSHRYPHIKIEVKRSMGSRVPILVLSHEFEVGVVSYRPSLKGLKIVPSAMDDMILIVHAQHRLAKRGTVSVSDLGEESFIAQSVQSPYRERVVEQFEKCGTPLNIRLELPMLEAIKHAVQNELGIAFMPKLTAQSEINEGSLVALKVREIQFQRRLHLVYREASKLSHAARAFLAMIRKKD